MIIGDKARKQMETFEKELNDALQPFFEKWGKAFGITPTFFNLRARRDGQFIGAIYIHKEDED